MLVVSFPFTNYALKGRRLKTELNNKVDFSWYGQSTGHFNDDYLNVGGVWRYLEAFDVSNLEILSMISIHIRPLWYGHFQNPALSPVLTVPEAETALNHSPALWSTMYLFVYSQHLMALLKYFSSPLSSNAFINPTIASAWGHQSRELFTCQLE